MNESERDNQIEILTRQGLSARVVRDRLGLGISVRRIQRIAMDRVGKSAPNKFSREYDLSHLRPYIIACLIELGRDPFLCQVCEERQDGECELHHTKYEGATIYDLIFVCHGCNQSRANKGLS